MGTEKLTQSGYIEVSAEGRTIMVRVAEINGRSVIVNGKWVKVAAVMDEDWQEGEVVPNPERFIRQLKQINGLRADIFSFSQKLVDPTPRFAFPYEWDSIAAVPTASYSDWWKNRVSTDLRRDVKLAAKRGVVVRSVQFTDDLVRGIKEIYDETPIRQGRPFWHYQKDFEVVKRANSSYLERSDFLGAFLGEALIGFLKIVYVDRIARLMQIIAKDAHRDKRPMNALIAKAIEAAESKGCSHLTYGKYHYSQGSDSVTAFKHRNGFEEILVPKYYIPLTMKGKLALRYNLHHGVRAMVPAPFIRFSRGIRRGIYSRLQGSKKAS
jgi:hypothetical protein